MSRPSSGSNGFAFYGNTFNGTGASVAGGDVNGDGLGDLIVGAPGVSGLSGDGEGYAYVVFGKEQAFASWLDAGSLNGSNGFAIKGPTLSGASKAQLGRSVAGSDLNHDGRDEVVVGAPNVSSPGAVIPDYVGVAYVVWGRASGFASLILAGGLNGIDGVPLYGYDGGGTVGLFAAGGFDFDADGRERHGSGCTEREHLQPRDQLPGRGGLRGFCAGLLGFPAPTMSSTSSTT